MSDDFKIRTVMTIDDSEIDQVLYKRVMKRSAMVEKVISFQFAKEALVFLKSDESKEIDVILLDVNMPCMSGFKFLEQASSELGPEFSTSVVIMLTNSLDPEDERRARQHKSVKAYLNKPLSLEGLESIVKILPAQE